MAEADKLRHNAQTSSAIKAYLRAAEMAKEAGNFTVASRALHLAGVSAKTAVTRPESSKLRDALTYFTAASLLYKEVGDNKHLGDLYRDVAVIYDYASMRSQAIKYYQKSVECLEKEGLSSYLALTYGKMGLHYYIHGDIETAKQYMSKSLDLFRDVRVHGYFQATVWLDYARILASAGDNEEAIEWAEQSLSWYLADHNGETFDRRRSQLYGLLSILYDIVGKSKLAKDYALKYEKLLKGFDPEAQMVIRKQLKETFDYEV